MFKKILIANRGEIACRIIRSCRRLGIGTVAVHSAADANALHVELADEAVAIGPAPATESYLKVDRIVEACKSTDAEAVHPGFGFLAENPALVKALDDADIAFIGPPTSAIAAMGDKIESKRLAQKAGVSTVPGHMGLIENAEEAVKIAKKIGYPVMIKASAGGGGKGMRVAASDAEVKEGFQAARNEARSSFADDRIFIEKFIEEPRHIEIQVLADGHGNVIHLGERECSIQRRHQKVIEEAPSPFIDSETRQRMGTQAVALAKAVDYRSAGTVEFIVDKNKNFYFLEMNTRIQVEHPVTELVVGVDLVEQMIRIAAGEKLALKQDDVHLDGWALEARVYAEDPKRGFLPSIGRLVRYIEPLGEHIRVDSGVVEGSEITMYYDPMIAKLVTHGADRKAAIARMEAALDAFYIRGINHNMAFLADVIGHKRFRDGEITTGFIAEEYPQGFEGGALGKASFADFVAVAAVIRYRLAEQELRIDQQLNGAPPTPAAWVVEIDRRQQAVQVDALPSGYRVASESRISDLSDVSWQPGAPLFRAVIDGRPQTFQIDRSDPGIELTHGGTIARALVMTPRQAELSTLMPVKEAVDSTKFVLSPMPGLLVSLSVEKGQEVKAGEPLAVVEAMKMENVLRAERDGKVAQICAGPGTSLAVDQAILEFE